MTADGDVEYIYRLALSRLAAEWAWGGAVRRVCNKWRPRVPVRQIVRVLAQDEKAKRILGRLYLAQFSKAKSAYETVYTLPAAYLDYLVDEFVEEVVNRFQHMAVSTLVRSLYARGVLRLPTCEEILKEAEKFIYR